MLTYCLLYIPSNLCIFIHVYCNRGRYRVPILRWLETCFNILLSYFLLEISSLIISIPMKTQKGGKGA